MRQSTLGSFIRFLRKQNQMTQAQLADRVGVTDKAVSKWERDVSYPDISIFPKLADIFGITVNDLLRECTDDGQPSRLLRVYEMSHDIRTPLHIILGCVDMAETYHADENMLLRYLESIRVSGEYLLRVLDRVLEAGGEDRKMLTAADFPANASELGEFLKKDLSLRSGLKRFYDFSGKRVLVAEDMELNREIAGEILKQTKARVEFAEDGEACLKMLEEKPAGYYDLILMDILMPKMDGLETTRRIRKLPDRTKAAIPIIAMTANVFEKDRNDAFAAGMDAFAEKPISTDKLFETMKKYLG
ncbi:MAG: response regulator [Clostridium sp.]|nr:response regulator [Clostridium sp.]